MRLGISKPLWTFFGWTVLLSGIFIFLQFDFFLQGFKTDTSGISFLIFILFLVGLYLSFRSSLFIHAEWAFMKKMKPLQTVPPADGGDGLRDLFGQVSELAREEKGVVVSDIVDAYYARHSSGIKMVAFFASVLITLGLLGTIVGLIIAVTGLDKIIQSLGTSQSDMLAGMRTTIMGMGIAFYTTFFGAIFGGVILRLHATNIANSLTELCATALEFIELKIIPRMKKSEISDMTVKARELNARLEVLGTSCGNVAGQLDTLVTGMTVTMAQFMKTRLDSLALSFSKVSEQLDGLMTSTTATMNVFSETVKKATEEVGDLTATFVDSRLDQVVGQLDSCASTIKALCRAQDAAAPGAGAAGAAAPPDKGGEPR